MTDLEKSLDEIISAKSQKNSKDVRRHRGKPRRNPREKDLFPLPKEDPEIRKLSQGKPYLKITNLHPDLSERDIGDLFENVGRLRFVRIMVDTAGQSRGIAYVGYEDAKNGAAAISKFDGRKAAGRVISVSNGIPLASRIGGGGRSKTRGKIGAARPRKEKPKKVTVEDLDAELEAYRNKKDGERREEDVTMED